MRVRSARLDAHVLSWQPAMRKLGRHPASIDARGMLCCGHHAVRLRPPAPADREAVAAFLCRLSPESMSMRFHAATWPRAELIELFIDPDWFDRGALIGVAAAGAGEAVVALGSYDRLCGASAAEVAFAVADDSQGHGIATRLLEQLANEAAACGIDRLIFEILPSSARMLAIVADARFPVERRAAGGVVEATMWIGAPCAARLRALPYPQLAYDGCQG